MSSLKKLWNHKFLFFIPAIQAIALFSCYIVFVCFSGLDDNKVSYENNWKITDLNATYESIKLTDYQIPSNVEVGSSVVFENVLDSTVPLRSTLRFRSYHSKVSVFLDNDCLYRYGYDLKESKLTGSGYSYVNLPENVVGKKLKIVFDIQETAACNTSLAVEFLTENVVSDYFAGHALSLCTGLFLVIFGLLLVCFAIAALGYRKSFVRLILIGFFAFFMGTWTLCYTKTIQVFSMDFSLNTNLEYFSLYLSPVIFEYFLLNVFFKRLERRKRKVLWGCFSFGTVFFVVTTILHILDIARYPSFLLVFHIYVIASFILIVGGHVLHTRRAGLQEKIVIGGLVVFLVFAAIDLVRFNILKFFPFFVNHLTVTILPVGTLLFIFSLVGSFLVYVYGMVKEMSEKEFLAQLAYRDILTGLYNRAKCESVFESLDKNDEDYAIVSIDLNGLKKVNDTYGHSEGDKFLTLFAKAFKNAFYGMGVTIRLGGDEFLAVVRSEHICDLKEAFVDMKRLEIEYSRDLPVELTASYGFACRGENNLTRAADVYQVADAKMYVMKQASKLARV